MLKVICRRTNKPVESVGLSNKENFLTLTG